MAKQINRRGFHKVPIRSEHVSDTKYYKPTTRTQWFFPHESKMMERYVKDLRRNYPDVSTNEDRSGQIGVEEHAEMLANR